MLHHHGEDRVPPPTKLETLDVQTISRILR
jgi:hypothetical protein